MKKRISRLTAALALGVLATTGIIITTQADAAPQMDTGWGAPNTVTPADTGWGTPPADNPSNGSTATTQSDTGWG